METIPALPSAAGDAGPALRRALEPFLPRLTVSGLAARGATPVGGWQPQSQALEVVALWIDLSGFTKLCERFTQQGRQGAERVSGLLDRYYGTVAREVGRFGGDVLFFAGDGALVVWPEPPGESRIGAANEAARAVRAALEEQRTRRGSDFDLRVRMALCAGPATICTVGGVEGRWVDVLVGPAVEAIAKPARDAAPNEIALTEVVRRRLRSSQGTAAELVPARPNRSNGDARGLLPYVIEPLAERLQAGQAEFVAEIRTVSVVFADLTAARQKRGLDCLQASVAAAQAALAHHGGTLYQVVEDDKGLTLIAAFGLPGRAHDDDPVRAVAFARAARTALLPLLGKIRCGVGTGSAFCGPCGDESRRQYSLVGSTINRAARLMAAADGEVLVDETTHRAARRRLQFTGTGPLALKGLGDGVVAYRGGAPSEDSVETTALVGRTTELRAIAEAAQRFAAGEGGVVIIEGAPGIGKTVLLDELKHRCLDAGMQVAWGAADAIELQTPHHAISGMLRRLLNLKIGDAAAAREGLDERLRAIGEDPELAAIVGPALGLAITETAASRQIAGPARGEARAALLTRLVARAVATKRWAVFLDDVQWMDVASWRLLQRLHEAIPQLPFALATRPASERGADGLAAFASGSVHLVLGGLPAAEVPALVEDVLGAPPSETLAALLAERSEGNPLFCRELALALRDRGRVDVSGERCELRASRDGDPVEIPDSLGAAIRSRVDGLPAEPQLTLKVASVLGQSLSQAVLAKVMPSHADNLPTSLSHLVSGQFLRRESGSPGRFAFAHALVRAATYDLLPEKQRRLLHDASARAIEECHAADLAPHYAPLSRHWEQAGDQDKATDYAARAASLALDGYANEEAVQLFSRALALDGARARRGPDVRRARWSLGLAQAHYSLTQPAEARAAYQAAMRALGFSEPGPWSIVRGLIRLVEKAPPVTAALGEASRPPDAERVETALGVLSFWGTLDVWEGRLGSAAAKAFAAERMAGRVLFSPRAGEVTSALGYMLGMTPLRSAAEPRLLRAVALADAAGDPEMQASTRVLLGMFHTFMGRAADALAPLTAAQAAAEKVGAGHWKHRTWFAVGESLMHLGQFERALAAFTTTAELAKRAEPPAVGFANAMKAAILNRLGRFAEALALVDGPDGLAVIKGNYLVLQRFASLGPKIVALLALGKLAEAREVGREAQALVSHGTVCDAFFAGVHGHAALAELGLAVARTEPGGAGEAARAVARLMKFSRFYLAAVPWATLVRGRALVARKKGRAALKLFERARQLAEAMALPWERARALAALAALDEGRRQEHLAAAREICVSHGIPPDVVTAMGDEL